MTETLRERSITLPKKSELLATRRRSQSEIDIDLTDGSGDYNHMMCEGIDAKKDTAKSMGVFVSYMAQAGRFWVQVGETTGFITPKFAAETNNWIGASEGVSDLISGEREKKEFDIHETLIDGEKVAVTIERIESRETAFGSLIHFKRDTERNDPKVYIIAPTSGHFSTLLIDTANQLLPNHDVYITDFKDVSNIPLSEGEFGFDDYIQTVQDDVEAIGPDVHILSVCQSTVPVLAAMADKAKQNPDKQPVLSITLMAGPVDTGAEGAETAVTKFADEHDLKWFRKNLIGKVTSRFAGAGRMIYPGDQQLSAFIAMDIPGHVNSFEKLFLYLASGDKEEAAKISKFYEEYETTSSMSGQFYLETILKVFKERQLAEGVMRRDNGDLIEPSYLTMPLMTVEGGKDNICAPGQTTPAHRLCSGIAAAFKRHYLQEGVGHYGVFNGSKWRDEIAPRFAAFIREAAALKNIGYDEPTLKTIKPDVWAPQEK